MSGYEGQLILHVSGIIRLLPYKIMGRHNNRLGGEIDSNHRDRER